MGAILAVSEVNVVHKRSPLCLPDRRKYRMSNGHKKSTHPVHTHRLYREKRLETGVSTRGPSSEMPTPPVWQVGGSFQPPTHWKAALRLQQAGDRDPRRFHRSHKATSICPAPLLAVLFGDAGNPNRPLAQLIAHSLRLSGQGRHRRPSQNVCDRCLSFGPDAMRGAPRLPIAGRSFFEALVEAHRSFHCLHNIQRRNTPGRGRQCVAPSRAPL